MVLFTRTRQEMDADKLSTKGLFVAENDFQNLQLLIFVAEVGHSSIPGYFI